WPLAQSCHAITAVPKQIAKINGIPPFHALLMVGNEYGKVRLAVLTATKGHASFKSPLEDMSKHLKLYGHEQPSICYTDQPGQDTTFLIETLPSLAPTLGTNAGPRQGDLMLPPETTPVQVNTVSALT
ncbi:hypothetical protein MVLG_07356, partial [Microbotryum lychnidis-dioicae p1A1 Lamole]